MLLLLRGDRFRPARLVRAGLVFFAATLLALVATARAADDDILVRELQPLSYADARTALLDAFVDEGLAPPAVSQFGDMLKRTAPDLGHRAGVYGEAEIFAFCSAQVSGRMVAEDVRHIALCPMTIALYTLPGQPRTVFLVTRPPVLRSPAGEFARALLDRIVQRTMENTGLPR